MASAFKPSTDGEWSDLADAAKIIPPSLAYLKPKRIWVSENSIRIELMRMMDDDLSFNVTQQDKEIWAVEIHSGHFLSKPRLLWAGSISSPRKEAKSP